MKNLKILLLAIALSFLAVGCGGSSSNDTIVTDTETETEQDVYIDWELNSTAVSGKVILPSGSPLDMNETSVEVVFNKYVPDSDGQVDIKVPSDQTIDTFVMLQNPQSGEYVVYLLATLLPDESSIVYSAEETAVSLVLNGINHIYLTETDTPEAVRDIIRRNSTAFIEEFVPALTNDPYLLRADNLINVYSNAFHDAVKASEAELKTQHDSQVASAKISDSSMLLATEEAVTDNQGLTVLPMIEQQDFQIRPDRGGLIVDGKMTGDLIIENDTMLPAKAKAVTMVPTEETTVNPTPGIFGDIVSAQYGAVTGNYARSTDIGGINYRAHEVTLYTPGRMDYSEDNADYAEVMAMQEVLTHRLLVDHSFRLIGLLLPVMSTDTTAFEDIALWILGQSFFTASYDFMVDGNFESAFWNIYAGMTNESNLQILINITTKYFASNPINLLKEKAKWLFKVASIKVQVTIYSADVAKTLVDLAGTSPVIKFTQVSFPLFLKNYGPSALLKVNTSDEVRRVELFGDGLNTFTASDGTYVPSITLEAKDVDDEIQKYILFDSEINSESSDSIWFNLPYEWVEKGSNIVGPIYFQFEHGFQDPVELSAITGIKIPHSVEYKEFYKIDLSSDVVITGFSSDEVVRGQEDFFIFGEGFAPSSDANDVLMVDSLNQIDYLTDVYLYSETSLQMTIPDDLAFGPVIVEVELDDGTTSNQKTISVIPKTVQASPGEPTPDFDDTLEVTLTQSEGVDIFYSINSGAETKYTGPITLTETSTVTTVAKVLVDNVEYSSGFVSYSYYKCSDTETFDPDTNTCVQNEIPDSCPPIRDENVTYVNDYGSYETLIWTDEENGDYISCQYYHDVIGYPQWEDLLSAEVVYKDWEPYYLISYEGDCLSFEVDYRTDPEGYIEYECDYVAPQY